MSPWARLAAWLGVRPSEMRGVALSFAGAFVVMSFLVLSRALRESAYLSRFDADTLPFAVGGVVALGIPAAAFFARAVDRTGPQRTMRAFTLGLAVAVAAIWPLLPESSLGIVVFYLVTAVGTVLLTSGFWLVTSETLVVREAKRLFALISAGGTLGVLVTGLGVGWAVQRWEPELLVPALVLLLLASAGLNETSTVRVDSHDPTPRELRWFDGVRTILRTPHVRSLTLVILLVAAVGTVIDFVFQEAAQEALGDRRALASFFGSFYAWTGGLALLVQLFLSTRILAQGGVARSVAVFPALVLGLSLPLLLLPGLATATIVRGADSTLKKSLFRSVVEFLWVPVRTDVRRRSKTVVDTTAENAGDGLGALIVLLLVTIGGLPPRYLALVVAALCVALLLLARHIGRTYFATLRGRLADGANHATLALERPDRSFEPRTLSRVDLARLLSTLEHRGVDAGLDGGAGSGTRPTGPRPSGATGVPPDPGDGAWTMVARGGDEELRARLASADLGPDDVPTLARWLARDGLQELVARRLAGIGEPAGRPLGEIVRDGSSDFVVRRRAAQVLAYIPGSAAAEALLAGLRDARFEVRYRSARALATRRSSGRPDPPELDAAVWSAVRDELSSGRAVWELARLLDPRDADDLAGRRAAARGELSLEHVFRLLGLVLDRDAIVAAWRGIVSGSDEVKSLALEYLEQVLPEDVRARLWPFIGDLSSEQAKRETRSLDTVIGELLTTGATLFEGDDRAQLRRYLDPETDDGPSAEPDGPD